MRPTLSLALAVCSDVYARGRQREAAVAMSKMSTTLSARKDGSARPASPTSPSPDNLSEDEPRSSSPLDVWAQHRAISSAKAKLSRRALTKRIGELVADGTVHDVSKREELAELERAREKHDRAEKAKGNRFSARPRCISGLRLPIL